MNITQRVFWLNLGLGTAAALLLLLAFFWVTFEERYERALLSNTQSLEFDLLETRNSLDRVHRTLELVKNSGLASQFLTRNPEARASVMYQVLRGILPSNEDYVQVRVLDVNAIEVLRIDRVDGELVLKQQSQLQNKSSRDYIQRASLLPPGSFLYSSITLNEELGRIEQPEWPALRGVAVLGDSQGQRLGYFIVNVRMDDVLEKLATSPFTNDAIVFDDSGRYLFHSDASKTFAPQRGGSASFVKDNPQAFRQVLESFDDAGLESQVKIIGKAKVFGKLSIPDDGREQSMYVLRILDENVLTKEVFNSMTDIVWVAFVVLGAIWMVGFTTARYLQGRFQVLNTMVSYFRAGNYTKGKSLVKQSGDQDDEIAQSGRAFANLVDEINASAKALELANTKTQRVFDSISSAIIVADDKGLILDCNRAATKIFAYSESELLGQNLKCLMPEEIAQEHDGYMARSDLGESARVMGVRRDLIAVRKNGEHFPIELVISRIKVQIGVNFVGVVTDLSGLKKSNDDLVRYSEKLRLSNQQLQRYAYALSHDLKAPVRKIKMFSQMIDRTPLSEEDRHHLARIENSAERGSAMIDALMNLALVESQIEDPQLCSLDEIARDAVQHALEQYPDVDLSVAYESLPSIICDRSLISSLFTNLVQNALKYAQKDGALALRISLADQCPEAVKNVTELSSGVCILFEDNGPGIEKSDHEAVFDIFYRAKPTQADIDGAGVGLSTCRKIMDAHDGYILIDPEFSQGTRFVLVFPENP